MAVDLINFKNLELLPKNKDNKLFIDNNNFLNINNDLKIKNLNITESNNIINFISKNDLKFDNNLLYKEIYSCNNDSRLFKNITNLDNNYCLELIDKINIKLVTKDEKEIIEIITDNLDEILPNSIKSISDFLPINKEYLFKITENNEIYIENFEDGIYKIFDRNNNKFELEFLNQKTPKPENINLKNKININSKKINDYKIFNKEKLFPIIIKSIQELYTKHTNNINNINDSISNVHKIPEIENKLDNVLNNVLINTEITNNLNATYQKLLNDNNRLQSQYLKCEEIIKENILLKKKIQNLEIQMSNCLKNSK